MNEYIKYNSVSEFITDLVNNEGTAFGDYYGRFWLYEDYEFFFKDLSSASWIEGLDCLHLYNEGVCKFTDEQHDNMTKKRITA
jgi:hypothetical protein